MWPGMAGVVLASLPLPHCKSSRVDRGCPGLSGSPGQVLTGVDPGCLGRPGRATTAMARRGGQPRTTATRKWIALRPDTHTTLFAYAGSIIRWPVGQRAFQRMNVHPPLPPPPTGGGGYGRGAFASISSIRWTVGQCVRGHYAKRRSGERAKQGILTSPFRSIRCSAVHRVGQRMDC
jgi:hypothetical protein